MENLEKLCLFCMKEKEQTGVCEHCGMTGIPAQAENALPAGTVLHQRYLLGKNIRVEGDGFTYVAYDQAEKSRVVVKEYFPEGIAQRLETQSVAPTATSGMIFDEGKLSFLRYARTLGRLREMSAVANLYDIVEENSTVYLVYEAVDGISLREYVKNHETPPLWEELRPLFMPLLASMVALHSAGAGHYGISPDNLIVQPNGKVKMIGYVIPECRQFGTEFATTLEESYAALEQYAEEGDLTEACDVYAVAACLFFALTGNEIKSAPLRKEDGRLMISNAVLGKMPRAVAAAMAGGLQIEAAGRTASLDVFRTALTGMQSLPKEQPEPQPEPENLPRKKSLPNWAVGMIAFFATLTVLSLAGWWYLSATNPNKNKQPSGSDPSTSLSEPSSEASSGEGTGESDGTTSKDTVSVSISENEVLAPNLLNEPLDTLEGSTTVVVLVQGREFNDEVAEGCVISQSVAPETVIAKGSVISVVVSKGAKMRVLPNVEGKTLEEAKIALSDEGFRIGKITTTDAGEEKSNRVLSFTDTAQKAGEKYEYGTTVNLTVGK